LEFCLLHWLVGLLAWNLVVEKYCEILLQMVGFGSTLGRFEVRVMSDDAARSSQK
jgi:hypothetical protein